MPKTPPRAFTVLARQPLTPHMLRLTLGGEAMRTFPADQASAYIKLVLPREDDTPARMRTYSVRRQREDAIEVDFVLHADGGPAANWARNARPGDIIEIAGPGPVKRVAEDADWYLLVGDMTALPAIAANLERLPPQAVGEVIIEVISEADIQPLTAPPGMRISWRIESHPGRDSEGLLRAVSELAWRPGKAGIWIACEFSAMRRLRRHLLDERGVDKREMYLSSYWKYGASEDGHRLSKREDAERESA
ncbi:siderophore-interacting protein [Salinicola endophyticus]|uniref:Siderophore-interacting protein n=1 Tax=Salinicola endophyticus TaxID=1949083 RepID=A0ABY8FI18_9GAMM|nr:siderophore-interacting protein [Salinicola endophyticus]WFF42469.1 siderophore-interacting protein [Salinicola endophyticus]